MICIMNSTSGLFISLFQMGSGSVGVQFKLGNKGFGTIEFQYISESVFKLDGQG